MEKSLKNKTICAAAELMGVELFEVLLLKEEDSHLILTCRGKLEKGEAYKVVEECSQSDIRSASAEKIWNEVYDYVNAKFGCDIAEALVVDSYEAEDRLDSVLDDSNYETWDLDCDTYYFYPVTVQKCGANETNAGNTCKVNGINILIIG